MKILLLLLIAASLFAGAQLCNPIPDVRYEKQRENEEKARRKHHRDLQEKEWLKIEAMHKEIVQSMFSNSTVTP